MLFRHFFQQAEAKESRAIQIQRSSYYNVYDVEYHPVYRHYRELTLLDHCYYLKQQAEIYRFIATKVNDTCNSGQLKYCPERLKGLFSISDGMLEDLAFYKKYLSAESIKVLDRIDPVTADYLDYIDKLTCPYELFGNYLALLGLNLYGGNYGIIPAMYSICQRHSEGLLIDMDFSSSKPKRGIASFPMHCRPAGAPPINQEVRSWIDSVTPPIETIVNKGYSRSIAHIKFLCDSVLHCSSQCEAIMKLDEDESTRREAKENDILVRLECGAKKHKKILLEKGFSKIRAFDDEKVSYGELGICKKRVSEIKEEDALEKDCVLLGIQDHHLKLSYFFQGKKHEEVLHELDCRRAANDPKYLDDILSSLVDHLPFCPKSSWLSAAIDYLFENTIEGVLESEPDMMRLMRGGGG